jgi:hypothetical protein
MEQTEPNATARGGASYMTTLPSTTSGSTPPDHGADGDSRPLSATPPGTVAYVCTACGSGPYGTTLRMARDAQGRALGLLCAACDAPT